MHATIDQKLQVLKKLPTIPAVIAHLEEVVEQPNSDSNQIAQVITDDPAIAAGVLRLVNSVLYRPVAGREVKDLKVAITRIGLRSVKHLAISTALFGCFSAVEQPAFHRKKFWQHCIAVGLIGDTISRETSIVPRREVPKDVVHLAGILHDIGKIVLEEHCNEAFHQAIAFAKEEQLPLYHAERHLLGIDHAEVGALLCEKWKMASALTDVVRHHHHPLEAATEEGRSLAILVHLANYICHTKALGESGNPVPELDERLRVEFGAGIDVVLDLSDRFEEAAKQSEIMMSLV